MFSHGSTELPHDAIRQYASNENHDGQVTISTTRSCEREWWKRSRDSTNKSLEEKKETYKKRRNGRYEEEEENNWMEHGRNGEMVFLPFDDRPKSGGNYCVVGKYTKQQTTNGRNTR